jgi:hypothetical protein
MYLILRDINSTLLKRISLAKYVCIQGDNVNIYLQCNLSGTGAGDT